MYDFSKIPNSLDAFWMPFTPERAFRKNPRMVTRAEGMYIYDASDRPILDLSAGLYCVNAGHNAPKIAEAIKAQMDQLHYVPAFNLGHPAGFMAASRLVDALPDPFAHVLWANSGSEAVDTALKVARAYHKARGEPSRKLLIGRERSYHGIGFGGLSVSGTYYNRAQFGPFLADADFLPHTHSLEHNRFVKGQPEWGGHLADNLERLVYVHGAENIAAVIVEPVTGSTGVLPPPKGYLEKLRAICDKYGILLIFDEVVTGFGRMGSLSASTYFNVRPDIITFAKGLTNGAMPMGATVVTQQIYDAFMKGPEQFVELMHGYTYSGHPLAAAACIGAFDTYEEGDLFAKAGALIPEFERIVHSLRDHPLVVDIRNCGLMAAVQLEECSPDDPYFYQRSIYEEGFHKGLYCRFTAYNLIITPPLIISKAQLEESIAMIGDMLHDLAARRPPAPRTGRAIGEGA
jgi:beta-alanine--pyruvate transaminase